MDRKHGVTIQNFIAVSFALFAMLVLCAGQSMAQTPPTGKYATPDAVYEDYLFVNCLKAHFPNVSRGMGNDPNYGHGYAHDPDSGRNFAWDTDKQSWIDIKTLKAVPCPKRANKGAVYEDYLFVNCLKAHFPNVSRGTGNDPNYGHGYAHDPDSGRNFAWDADKQAWIDTKTLECVCPKCPPPATPTPTPKTASIPDKTYSQEDYAKAVEFFGGYQYQRAPDETVKNLYGFNGSLFYNVTPHVSIGGDFSFLFGSTSETVGTSTFDTSLHRQTYLFGPQFNFYPDDKVKIFVHPLFGGVHDTVKFDFGNSTTDSSASAFAMAFGGGVDVRVSPRVSFRVVEADYVGTHFGGEFQNNFRLSTGLVLRFGGK